jgi:type IV secretory pathway VirB2 component (pilin)
MLAKVKSPKPFLQNVSEIQCHKGGPLKQLKRFLSSPWIWIVILGASPLMAQVAGGGGDPVTRLLTLLVSLATGVWAKLIVVLGTVYLAVRIMGSDHHSIMDVFRVVAGGAILVGAQTFVNTIFAP